jgi:hypothetical protein
LVESVIHEPYCLTSGYFLNKVSISIVLVRIGSIGSQITSRIIGVAQNLVAAAIESKPVLSASFPQRISQILPISAKLSLSIPREWLLPGFQKSRKMATSPDSCSEPFGFNQHVI